MFILSSAVEFGIRNFDGKNSTALLSLVPLVDGMYILYYLYPVNTGPTYHPSFP